MCLKESKERSPVPPLKAVLLWSRGLMTFPAALPPAPPGQNPAPHLQATPAHQTCCLVSHAISPPRLPVFAEQEAPTPLLGQAWHWWLPVWIQQCARDKGLTLKKPLSPPKRPVVTQPQTQELFREVEIISRDLFCLFFP